jgi:nucleotide-binding universal stress UspA family protein
VYKKILIPLENGPADEVILQHIRKLAKINNSDLLLIHVADGFVARNKEQLNLADSPEIKEDRAYLDKRREELVAEGFNVEALLEYGEPAKKILDAAEEKEVDLIAMATHGHRWLSDFILGSVASTVRHRTEIPVLLLKAFKN